MSRKLALIAKFAVVVTVAGFLASCGSSYQIGGQGSGDGGSGTGSGSGIPTGIVPGAGVLSYNLSMTAVLNNSPTPSPTPCDPRVSGGSLITHVPSSYSAGYFYSDAFTTDNTLKAALSSGGAGQNQYPWTTSSSYTANYGCMAMTVTLQACVPNPNNMPSSALWNQIVNNPTSLSSSQVTPYFIWADNGAGQDTGILQAVGGDFNCASNPTSKLWDFSQRLSPGAPAVRVKVTNPRSDYRCIQCYANPYLWTGGGQTTCASYCPLSTYQYNTVTGTLYVAPNGTSLN